MYVTTRNLLAKTYTYVRQNQWDRQDSFPETFSPELIAGLEERLNKRPPEEIERAAKELGIPLGKATQELTITLDKVHDC